MTFLIKNILGTLLLPPANGLLLLFLAFVFRHRRRAFALALAGAALLLAQSVPIVARTLIAPLEENAGPLFTAADGAGAIVVLGGGLKLDAPEYGGDTANERSLTRLRYGVALARQSGLPVLVSGGRGPAARLSEAEVLADIAEKEFGLAVRWQESESTDTADNAQMAAAILKAAGIGRVVLVTHAFHMPRARRLFEAAGLSVVPAPTEFRSRRQKPIDAFDFLPQASANLNSYYALHEYLGLLWAALPRP